MGTITEKLSKVLETKSAIKNAIVNKGVDITDDDTFSSYAEKIEQIESGTAVNTKKLGLTIDNFLGDVDDNGVLSAPSGALNIDFTGVKEIGAKALNYAFYKKNINSINASDIEVIQSNGMHYACQNATMSGGDIIFTKLHTVIGNSCLDGCFYGSDFKPNYISFLALKEIKPIDNVKPNRVFNQLSMYKECVISFPVLEIVIADTIMPNLYSLPQLPKLRYIESLSTYNGALGVLVSANIKTTYYELPSLEEVGPYGLYKLINGNKYLQILSLPKVHTIGTKGCAMICYNATALTRMDFPSLINVANDAFGQDSSSYAFSGCTALTEIHFRADMQETISTLIGYADKWGATNATIYFDL